eukprot:12279604-Ditylum_brightwellii.AAC.1
MANNKHGHDVLDERDVVPFCRKQTFRQSKRRHCYCNKTAETNATVISTIATMLQTQQSDKTQRVTLPENQ